MSFRLRGPSVHEQANGDEDAIDDLHGDAELWFADAVVAGLEAAVEGVVERGGDLGAEEEAQSHGDVVE